MKQYTVKCDYVILALLLTCSSETAFAQSPTGAFVANQIDAGTIIPQITTTQSFSNGNGVYAMLGGRVILSGGWVSTQGQQAYGLMSSDTGSLINWQATQIKTSAFRAHGVNTTQGGQVIGFGQVETSGDRAHAVQAGVTTSGAAPASVKLLTGTRLHTFGNGSYGLHAYGTGTIDADGIDVVTEGIGSFGAHAEKDSSILLKNTAIETHGKGAFGILANTDDILLGVAYTAGQLVGNNITVKTTGAGAFGALADREATITLHHSEIETVENQTAGVVANNGGKIAGDYSVTTLGQGSFGAYALAGSFLDGAIDLRTNGINAHGVVLEGASQAHLNNASIKTLGAGSSALRISESSADIRNSQIKSALDHGILVSDSSQIDLTDTVLSSAKSAIEVQFSKPMQTVNIHVGGASRLSSQNNVLLSVDRNNTQAETGNVLFKLADFAIAQGNIIDQGNKTTGFTDVEIGRNATFIGRVIGVRNLVSLNPGTTLSFNHGSTFTGDLQGGGTSFDFSEGGSSIGDDLILRNGSHAWGGSKGNTNHVGGNVLIDATSSLKGFWDVAHNLVNDGTISPGNSPGTLVIAGNFVAGSNNNYEADIEFGGASDLIKVGGTASLAGRVTVISGGPFPGFDINKPYTILTAAGGLNGTRFDGGVTWQNPSRAFLFLAPSLSYDANNAFVTIGRNSTSFASLASTENARSVAAALDASLLTSPLAQRMLLQFNAQSVDATLNGLTGETHQTTLTALHNDAFYIRDTVLRRLDDAFDERQSAIWAQPFTSDGRWLGNAEHSGMDADRDGMFFGADMNPYDNLRLGLVGGIMKSTYVLDRAQADADSYQIGAYGNWDYQNFALRGGAAYSLQDVESARNLTLFDQSAFLKSDYHANTVQVFGETGYRIKFNGLALEPFAGLTYVNTNRDGFAEHGNDAALSVKSTTVSTTYSTLGAHASYSNNISTTTALALRASSSWRRAYGDLSTASNFTLDQTQPFRINGLAIARDTYVFSAGLQLQYQSNMAISFDYTGQLASRMRENAFKTLLAIKF